MTLYANEWYADAPWQYQLKSIAPQNYDLCFFVELYGTLNENVEYVLLCCHDTVVLFVIIVLLKAKIQQVFNLFVCLLFIYF